MLAGAGCLRAATCRATALRCLSMEQGCCSDAVLLCNSTCARSVCRHCHAIAPRQATVAAHPGARKVWDAVLPRLLLPLAAAAFQAPTGDAVGGGAAAGSTLAALSRAVLEAVLFHPAHIPGGRVLHGAVASML